MTYTPISQIESSSAWGNHTEAANPSEMGQDQFLKIFMAQLEYQDPMNPTSSEAFVAQLAQFSSLEQLMRLNAGVETVALLQASLNNANAASFIGREVRAVGSNLSIDGGAAPDINFDLGEDASTVSVKVFDEDGNVVRTLDAGAMTSGPQELPWDGLDDNGNVLPDGDYSFTVEAADDEGNAVNVDTFVVGTVDRVVFEDGATFLEISGIRVRIGDVVEIR